MMTLPFRENVRRTFAHEHRLFVDHVDPKAALYRTSAALFAPRFWRGLFDLINVRFEEPILDVFWSYYQANVILDDL